MPNHLTGETSPYLLQHAGNPVEWYPWGAEALDRARREDKPILLSIGYSACHWCHVMAHESFEDGEVANLMNAHYVNIKVDREERPDLDQIYQSAHALLTRRSGGWPLTMFLTSEGEPFFGGTYYPKHARYGVPGFLDVLPRIAAAWRDQRAVIVEQNAHLRDIMAEIEPKVAADDAALPASAPAAALTGLKHIYDAEHGGFGAAPKFPHPAELEFCLRQYARRSDVEALEMVRHTLQEMAEGGIHDQLGGGFCRYSVDAEWSIPHFEKMLYDNGPLLALYADVARITGDRAFDAVARGIVGWMTREMRHADGAFYSSLDADSEGHEGKFYVWDRAEVQRLLAADDFAVAAPYFGFDRAPNFEGHAWNPRVATPLMEIAQRLGITLPDAQTRLMAAKATLFAARSKRVRPGLDDKILTSWNALAIAGLARAARACAEPGWAELAIAAADALRATAWKDGRLLATRKGDKAHLNAYLDDYAFLLAALLELMQARFRVEDFAWACELADVLLAQFEDRDRGGFFFTSHDHEALIHRMKPGPDGATPSGNGVAARALIALGHLADAHRYVDAGERTLRLFAPMLARSPSGFPNLLSALEHSLQPPTSVLLTGERVACEAWQRELERTYRPDTQIFNVAAIAQLPAPLQKGRGAPAGATAWVCRGTACLPPLTTVEALADALSAHE